MAEPVQSVLDNALATVAKAIEADQDGDAERALSMYTLAVENFMYVLKYEKNANTLKIIRPKVVEYLKRAEEIKAALCPSVSTDPPAREDDSDTVRLHQMLAGTILTEVPDVHWEDVAGLSSAKEILKETVVLPKRFPDIFVGGRRPWRGILMYGPPGTGKTHLAKAVATEVGGTFFSVSASSLMSKWLGESERLVKALFDMARKKAPAVVFIDEIDSLVGQRTDGENDSTHRVKTEFLVQMDGVGTESAGVLVLAATNTPWSLDPAMRRRFERRIYIGLPEPDVIAQMITRQIAKNPHELTSDHIRQLSLQCKGFSGSDITTFVRTALMQPVHRVQVATHFRRVPRADGRFVFEPCSGSDAAAEEMTWESVPACALTVPTLTFSDFTRSMAACKATVSTTELGRYDEFTESFGMHG